MMGASFQSRFERLELKYLVHEQTAVRSRRDLEVYCQPDPLLLGQSPRGYEIRSLYLDSPSLALHHAKERGDPERIKLRIRSYASDATFLEIKRRTCDVIEKTRAAIQEQGLADAAHGLAKLRQETADARSFVDRFARLTFSIGAQPTLLVRYLREAYSSALEDDVRITLDRDLAFQRTEDWTLDGRASAWADLDPEVVPSAPNPFAVLELKCPLAVPGWLVDVIRRHRLRRDSFSKYSLGIYLTGRGAGAPRGQERARGVLR